MKHYQRIEYNQIRLKINNLVCNHGLTEQEALKQIME